MTDERWLYSPDAVSAPGDSLRELLEKEGLRKRLGHSNGPADQNDQRDHQGKAQITPDTAVQLERALSLPAAFWNEREAHYRGYLARVEADKNASRWVAWLDELPLKEMMEAEALPKRRIASSIRKILLNDALKFFGVASQKNGAKSTLSRRRRTGALVKSRATAEP